MTAAPTIPAAGPDEEEDKCRSASQPAVSARPDPPPWSSARACFGTGGLRLLACLVLLAPAAYRIEELQSLGSSRLLRRLLSGDEPRADGVPEMCSQYGDPYWASTIQEDLLPWSSSGISAQMMDATFEAESYYRGRAGLPVVIKGGSVHVLDRGYLDQGVFFFHARELLIYAQVLLHLEQYYGHLLPDAEFLINTNDDPQHDLLAMTKRETAPVFRFCRGEDHGEVLVPIWHFYEQFYSRNFLDPITLRERQRPWEARAQQLFSVPGGYHRHVSHKQQNQKYAHDGSETPNPRHEFVVWAQAANDSRLNIREEQLEMGEWSHYRWVAHVDGITCSSRLEKLLSLGSLVLKEESGYRAFYHRLLQPFVHYVPFWRHRPQEALQAVDWAQAHDAQAAGIARAGQALVKKYLSKPALDCYWLMLLHEWSKLLRYKPAAPDRNHTQPLLPVSEWLAKMREHHEPAGLWVGSQELELYDPAEQQQQQ